MLRKATTVAVMLLAISSRVAALGLGDIDMQSALNQPMQATVHLTSSQGTDPQTVKVSVASLEQHARAGIKKSVVLSGFKFRLEKTSAGELLVRITSHDAITEPFIEFILEMEWPRGKLMRQYTLLVDPPVTMPAAPATPAVPVSRPAVAHPIAPSPAPVTRAVPVAPPAAQTTVAVPAPSAQQAPVDSYGQIKRSDTLWSIAEKIRPDNGVGMHQMMQALLRANPDAFIGNNINHMKAGATLTIPDRDFIIAVSEREAMAESRRQAAEWQQMTAAQDADVAAAADPDAAADAAMQSGDGDASTQQPAAQAATAKGAGRLKLIAPDGDAVAGAAAPGDTETTATATDNAADDQQLELVSEELVASKAQSAELQSRVDELEQQITTMKRLLELKDDELASLQSRAAAEPVTSEVIAENESADEQAVPAIEPAPVTEEPQALAGEPVGVLQGLLERAREMLGQSTVLAGLGVLVALIVGGFLWSASRNRQRDGTFDAEISLDGELAASRYEEPATAFSINQPVSEEIPADEGEDEIGEPATDPVTEADVYLAYGRIEQAESVLQAELQHNPANQDARMKLLEVYHAGGDVAAFDQVAMVFRQAVGDDDPRWEKVVSMGQMLSPGNELYGSGVEMAGLDGFPGAVDTGTDLAFNDGYMTTETLPDNEVQTLQDSALDDALDLEDNRIRTVELPQDETGFGHDDEMGEPDGVLTAEDEVTTKLDLARAYIDMDDPDSARSILGEVMSEGNDAQKEEAEQIIARLA